MTAQLRLRGLPWLLAAALLLALGPALLDAVAAPADPLADAAICSAHADSGNAPAPQPGHLACDLCLLGSLHHAGVLPAPPPLPPARAAVRVVRLPPLPNPRSRPGSGWRTPADLPRPDRRTAPFRPRFLSGDTPCSV